MSHIAAGIIVEWFGAIVDIPDGWTLCDGTLGTPDLTDKFVIGAGDTYNPGDIGGSITHNHAFTSDGHNHVLTGGTGITPGTGISQTTSVETVSGFTAPVDGRPPFYALAYIMAL